MLEPKSGNAMIYDRILHALIGLAQNERKRRANLLPEEYAKEEERRRLLQQATRSSKDAATCNTADCPSSNALRQSSA